MITTIVAQQIIRKPTTNGGMRTGIKDAKNVWYSTFDSVDVKEGGEYVVDYVEKNGFNNITSINPVSKTENQVANGNRQDAIIRQHSQAMALQYFIATTNTEFSDDELKAKIDWFDADVKSTEAPF